MEISTAEKAIIDETVEVAGRKYDAKLADLRRVAGKPYSLEKWLGNAARWLRDHEKDPAAAAAGIEPVDHWEAIAGDRCKARLDLQLDGGIGRVELHYELNYPGDCYMSLPVRPKPENTSTLTIDAAADALRRMDTLLAVAIRFARMRDIVRERELEVSEARAEKARHQLELLKKL